MKENGGKVGTQAVIGAFVLGGAVLVLSAIVLFGKFHFFSKTLRAVIVFQDSISGLTIGAPVTFRGVRVGAVESINVEFDAQTKIAYIPVTVLLEPAAVIIIDDKHKRVADHANAIPSGLRAELNVESFVTGQSEIGLDFDADSAAVLHPDIAKLPEIPTKQSDMQRVTEQLSKLPLRELTDNAAATLRSLRALSEKLNLSFPPLIDSVKRTSDRADDVIGHAGKSITELQGRLDIALADISRLAGILSLQVNQRGGDLRTVLISANQTIVQARGLMTDLKSITSDRGNDRADVESVLRDMAAAASSLRGLSNEVEHNPQLLLTGRRP
jgi:paraquat-inducible protein B